MTNNGHGTRTRTRKSGLKAERENPNDKGQWVDWLYWFDWFNWLNQKIQSSNGLPAEAVLLYLIEDGFVTDVQQFCRKFTIPVGLSQDLQDDLPLCLHCGPSAYLL